MDAVERDGQQPAADRHQQPPPPAARQPRIADRGADDARPEGMVEAKHDGPQKDVGHPGREALFQQDGQKVGHAVFGEGKPKADHGPVDDAVQHVVELARER